jgi:hypothetical protein
VFASAAANSIGKIKQGDQVDEIGVAEKGTRAAAANHFSCKFPEEFKVLASATANYLGKSKKVDQLPQRKVWCGARMAQIDISPLTD